MNILFLTQIVPFPPDAGSRVKTFNVLKYLHSKGHRIDLITFYRPDEKIHMAELEKYCRSVKGILIERSMVDNALQLLKYFLTKTPFLVGRDNFPAMRNSVNEAIETRKYDILHADQLSMCQFFIDIESIPRVFDAHNATWLILDRSVENAFLLLKPILKREANKTLVYEQNIIRSFDHTFTVTQNDSHAFINKTNQDDEEFQKKITSIPVSIDPDDYPPKKQRQHTKRNLLTLGTLNYPPNGDGIIWFLEEVFPLILQEKPDCVLTILGKKPPVKLQELAETYKGKVQIMGYVPSVDPYFDEAEILLVPVRYGGGMRVRIIEGFARKIPVVTTTVGIEGIEASNHVHAEIHDDPQGFANAVQELLDDPERQRKLVDKGYGLLLEKYSTNKLLGKMEQIYSSLTKR